MPEFIVFEVEELSKEWSPLWFVGWALAGLAVWLIIKYILKRFK